VTRILQTVIKVVHRIPSINNNNNCFTAIIQVNLC